MRLTTELVRVLFVDDNVLAARAVERWFVRSSGLEFSGWARNAEDAVEMTARTSPAVVLLDLDMPGTDTLVLIPRLVEASPATRVVMFSGHMRPGDIGRALDAGAAGYIGKDEPTAVITTLMRRVAAGEHVLSPLAQRAYLGGP